MAESLGSAVLDLKTSDTAFVSGLRGTEAKAKGFGGRLSSALKMGGVGGAIALGGLGVAAFKMGSDFESAYATIRAGTGKTGAVLEGLKGDFRDILKGGPESMAAVATATADLNTRLGLSGPPLRAMSRQYLDLARITKTDVATVIAAGTRVMGDWSIATEMQGDALEHMLKVSQETGIGVDSLAQKVVNFGAPLRQFGFGFKEATALLGKWEKEGVNSEAILGALKIGVANFAREGIDAQEGLAAFVEELTAMGAGAEATSRAIEIFGSRAGPDMAAAVTEGRFSLEDLLHTLEMSDETINRAAQDTLKLSDRFAILKNKAMVAAEPVLTRMFIGLEKALIKLTPWLEEHVPEGLAAIREGWEEIEPIASAFMEGLRGFIDNTGPDFVTGLEAVRDTAGTMKDGLEKIMPPLRTFFNYVFDNEPAMVIAIAAIGTAIAVAFGPASTALVALMAIVYAIGVLKNSWESLADTWKRETAEQERANKTWIGRLEEDWNEHESWWGNFWPGLRAIAEDAWGGMRIGWDLFWSTLKFSAAGWAWGIKELWGVFWRGLVPVAEDAWGGIQFAAEAGLAAFGGAMEDLGAGLLNNLRQMANGVADIIDAILAGARRIKNLPGLNLLPGDVPGDMPRPWNPPPPPTAEEWTQGRMYHQGGIVPGPAGSPQLAIVQGGERILTEEQQRAMGHHFEFHISAESEPTENMLREWAEMLKEEINDKLNTTSLHGSYVGGGVFQ